MKLNFQVKMKQCIVLLVPSNLEKGKKLLKKRGRKTFRKKEEKSKERQECLK